jgi:hypothetical protein
MPWEPLTDRAEILAVHAAYMGFGQILYFSGNQHDEQHSQTGDFDAARLFDCGSFAVTYTKSPSFDTFCCGHAFLRSGNEVRLLAAGGTERWSFGPNPAEHHRDHWPGLRDAAVYRSPNFVTPTGSGWEWEEAARMNTAPTINTPHATPERSGGRWYPTLTTLPNGDVMALSGHPGSSTEAHNNDLPEVFSPEPPPRGRWRRLGSYGSSATLTHYTRHSMILYPRIHLIPSRDYGSSTCPSGEFLVSSPINRATFTFRPDVGPHRGDFACVCPFRVDGDGDPIEGYGWYHSTSVLLPLRPGDDPNDPDGWQPNGYEASVLICGGENPQPYRLDLPGWKPALTNPERCATAGPWKWRETARRETGRRRVHANATILPTGEILVTGGIDIEDANNALDEDAVREPELYDPYNDQWTLLNDPAPLGLHDYGARNYHSVALLMPDGRVWVAGSSVNHEPGLENANLDIDVYAPWYHDDPERPHVTAAPSLAQPGETIYVRSTHADEIERIVLVRCGSCTHAFNSDQRLIELRFNHVTADVFFVTMPPNNTVMPPGPYYIFTIRHKDGTLGLPSDGADIYIVPERDPERGRPHG